VTWPYIECKTERYRESRQRGGPEEEPYKPGKTILEEEEENEKRPKMKATQSSDTVECFCSKSTVVGRRGSGQYVTNETLNATLIASFSPCLNVCPSVHIK
jgi:hypothetical protein